jgi:hypothetical protein
MSDGALPDDLAKAARRRWLVRSSIVGGITAVLAVVLSPILSGTNDQVSHKQTTAGLIISFAFIAVIGALLLIMLRRIWRGKGRFAIPLATGLPRGQRKAVTRAVRHGAPSGDPTLRLAEDNLAESISKQVIWSRILLAALTVGTVAGSLLTHETAARWYYIVVAILMVVAFVVNVRIGPAYALE